MDIKAFKIGMRFFTDAGQWEVIDVGSRTVTAYNIKEDTKNNINWDEKNSITFYPYDFEGCWVENDATTDLLIGISSICGDLANTISEDPEHRKWLAVDAKSTRDKLIALKEKYLEKHK